MFGKKRDDHGNGNLSHMPQFSIPQAQKDRHSQVKRHSSASLIKEGSAGKGFWHSTRKKAVSFFFFVLAAFFFWALIQILQIFFDFSLIGYIKGIPYVYPAFRYFFDEIRSGSMLGVAYLFLFSSMFFLPVPLEALFIKLLTGTSQPITLLMYTVAGVMAGQIINYILGRLFGFIFMYFISKDTRDNYRKKLERYGAWAVVAIHLIPFFPFPLFNFICGVLKYPMLRWLLFAGIGILARFVAVYILYTQFSGALSFLG